jgi:hypothetical protein
MTFEYAFSNEILKRTSDEMIFNRESFHIMDVFRKVSLDVHKTQIVQIMG